MASQSLFMLTEPTKEPKEIGILGLFGGSNVAYKVGDVAVGAYTALTARRH